MLLAHPGPGPDPLMEIDLQEIAVANGHHIAARLPELVDGVVGSVIVHVNNDALPPGNYVRIKMTLDMEVRSHGD